MKLTRPFAALATSAIIFAACSSSASPSAAPSESAAASEAPSAAPSEAATPAPEAAKVRLQLQWVPQAQFAGYFAADREGYFAAENLQVEILPGGPDIVPQQVGSAPDGPEFTLSWVPKVLEAREQGSDLVDIAQVFQRSGTLSVTWKSDNITDICQLAGKKVGTWGFGNEFEVTAGLANNCGLTPGLENGGDPATQYQQVTQAFDMVAFLNHEINAAEAMTYNEYAQVLESTNPETGQLYQPADLNVFNWNDYRSAMLQDAVWARKSWLDQGNNKDVATRFVRASLKGWIFCRDNPDKCVQYTTDAGSQLGAGHQAWMMNEINALIWPSVGGVGMMDPIGWQQTVKIAKQAGIIKADPSIDAYTTEIAKAALAGIEGDTTGEGFVKAEVAVTPGGN